MVFGGLNGLEASLDADPDLDAKEPSELFDHYLNTCPGQGSRTIRTEVLAYSNLSIKGMYIAPEIVGQSRPKSGGRAQVGK